MINYWDLSIGNYVVYNDRVVKVAAVTKRKIGYHLKPNETTMHYARLSEVEPIEMICEYEPKRNNHIDSGVGVIDPIEQFSEVINQLSGVLPHLQYVHEYQNAIKSLYPNDDFIRLSLERTIKNIFGRNENF